MIANTSNHGGRDAETLVNPAEVVEGEVQAVGRPQVLPLLAESVGEPRHAPHLHTDREVLAFDMAGADFLRIGIPHDRFW